MKVHEKATSTTLHFEGAKYRYIIKRVPFENWSHFFHRIQFQMLFDTVDIHIHLQFFSQQAHGMSSRFVLKSFCFGRRLQNVSNSAAY